MTFPVGRPRAFDVNNPVGQSYYYLRPPEGWEWIILEATAFHNDDVSGTLECYWELQDEEKHTKSMIGYNAALATWENFSIYSIEGTQANDYNHPMKLTHSFWAVFNAISINAAKMLTLKFNYIERPLNYELLFDEIIAYRLGFKLPLSSKEY